MRPSGRAGASKPGPGAQPEPRAVRTEVPSWPDDEHGGRQRQRLAVPRGNAPSVPPIVRVLEPRRSTLSVALRLQR
jgi:hypothetical protein